MSELLVVKGQNDTTRRSVVTRVLRGLAAMLLVAPLVVLPLRAVAQVWRAPAIIPQQFGTRGITAVAGVGEALTNSTLVALVATLIAGLLAWPASRRLASSPGRRTELARLALALPVLVPPFATGTGLTTWLLRAGLADSIPGLVVAHLPYVLAYVVLLLAPAFGPEVDRLDEAAATFGATGLRRVWLVTIPAVRGQLVVALLLGFLVSWSQYGTSLAVGGGIPMLPVVLVPFVRTDPQVAAALSLVFLAPVGAAFVAGARFIRSS